ncbi:MAG: L-histidine N(alpha)-methyltransferase [Pseudomonadota bacterium]
MEPSSVTRQGAELDSDLAEILDGLSRPQKFVSPKFFYDQRGSELFDAITEQPEYYPTQTELGIMQANIAEIRTAMGAEASLIEFGSGSSYKTRFLLEQLPDLACYVPVDISEDFLLAIADGLAKDFPKLEILPVVADFTREFELPSPTKMPAKNVVYFPGSTIGNFMPDAAMALLRVMRAAAKAGGALLIGVDLKKDKARLEAAYNDAAGVTADFNLNLLLRLNREFEADFDVEAFEHRAIYNETLGRIEMHLVSRQAQTVYFGTDHRFDFQEGEYILSECSHKYAVEEFGEMVARAGFEVANVWVDAENLFSVQFCIAV